MKVRDGFIQGENDQKNLLKCHCEIPFDLFLISFHLPFMPKG